MNRGGCPNGASRYKGVTYEKTTSKWVAVINILGMNPKKIGRYENELHAATAYDLAVESIFGKDSDIVHLNKTGCSYSIVNTNNRFFNHWVPILKQAYEEKHGRVK